jgi:MerR family transcriptional regulator, thiopeptide resistance regulator
MSWSINEVARTSGVSSRTLRHYHAIGLLEPESTEFSGRRRYGRGELIRLQEILTLRDLGLPLKEIARVLDADGGVQRGDALRSHLAGLRRERSRLERMIRTVQQTIEEGDTMSPEQIFDGFEENPYEAEARERWGDEAVDASKERLANLSPEERTLLQGGFAEVHEKIAALHRERAPLDDPRLISAIEEHHGIVSLAWEPSPRAYAGLGRMYVEDDRFREVIGRGDDAMVEYLRDAMAAYADRL